MDDQAMGVKFERYRSRLQDFSKRNHLLYYRDTKGRTLRFLEPGIGVLWDELICGDRSLTFPRPSDSDVEDGFEYVEYELPEEPEEPEGEASRETDGDEAADDLASDAPQLPVPPMPQLTGEADHGGREGGDVAGADQGAGVGQDIAVLVEEEADGGSDVWATKRRHADIRPSEVQLDKEPKAAQRVLQSLARSGRTAIEEQGVNVLYLGFGMLTWTDVSEGEGAFQAPLVMVPVSLDSKGIDAPYVLAATDDDVVANPTLRAKLEGDLGVTLPDLDAVADTDLAEYLRKVRAVVAPHPGWHVSPEVVLGVFQFEKISMYHDLARRKEEILAHPVARAIMGDTDCMSSALRIDTSDIDLDARPAEEVLEVLDADSSQEEAIVLAERGESFVLEGPPGTGKSQTIANIIADLLFRGKRVLFVSEKKAALDVVHSRLERVGLADFCLVMHRTKAAKRSILDQLGHTLALAQQRPVLDDRAVDDQLHDLAEHRSRLNDYAGQVFERIDPLGMSLFEAYGRLAEHLDHGVSDVRFAFDAPERVSARDYASMRRALEDLAAAARRFPHGPQESPWNGCTVRRVDTDVVERTREGLEATEAAIGTVEGLRNRLADECDLPFELEADALDCAVSTLRLALACPLVPASWLVRDSFEDLEDACRVAEGRAMRRQALLGSVADALGSTIAADPGLAGLSLHGTLDTADEVASYRARVQEELDGLPCYRAWLGIDADSFETSCRDVERRLSEYGSMREAILSSWDEGILHLDHHGMGQRFRTQYSSALRRLSGSYRADLRTLASLRRDGGKLGYEEALALLDYLDMFEAARESVEALPEATRQALGGLYGGIETDMDAVRARRRAFDGLEELLRQLGELEAVSREAEDEAPCLERDFEDLYRGWGSDWLGEIPEAMEAVRRLRESAGDSGLAGLPGLAALLSSKSLRERVAPLALALDDALDELLARLEWLTQLFGVADGMGSVPLQDIARHVRACLDDMEGLDAWADYRTRLDACVELGLAGYAERMDEVPSELVVPAFERRFLTLWIDAVLPTHPAVRDFRRDLHERDVERFRALDERQCLVDRDRIRAHLIEGLPDIPLRSSGHDEVGILRRELQKRSRIRPVRRLFADIPNLVMRLKPCMMMSPLSVSTFLQSDDFRFDAVIFDEASQVRTEDALGSISRATQVIIAGDSHQLPPTSFFRKTGLAGVDADDADYEDDSGSFESVLDEAATALPTQTLLWHYRSRDESLIAFSNVQIYGGSLVTFPSSVQGAPDTGVEYVHVDDDIYLGQGGGNRVEAEVVCDLVFDHFRRYGRTRSLGVIAFSERQGEVIDAALRRRRKQDGSFEEFFSGAATEPFFVKSLENVQGDERDTIILCVGYARDRKGVLHLSFGPLSVAGGERRLNVAITRAKLNVKLVTSLVGSDIDVRHTENEGPKLLAAYLDFARLGQASLAAGRREAGGLGDDLLLEASVRDALAKEGLDVVTQVGCSEYRVDVAVRDPKDPTKFVLGIGCDGASYHTARTARERDRLRDQVLSSMGWRLYRVWSPEWTRHPREERRGLIDAAKAALEAADEVRPRAAGELSGGSSDVPDGDADDSRASQPRAGSLLRLEEEDIDEDNPYGFDAYETYRFDYRRDDANPLAYACHILEVERPMAEDALLKRVLELTDPGARSLTARRRDALRRTLAGIAEEYDVREDGDGTRFLHARNPQRLWPRLMGERRIGEVCELEVAVGMLVVGDRLVGEDREGLLAETARAFGIRRRSKAVNDKLDRAFELLLGAGAIGVGEGGKVVIRVEPPSPAGDGGSGLTIRG